MLDLPRLPPRTARLYEKSPGPLEITSSSSKHEIVHSRYGMLFSVAGGGGVSIFALQDKQFHNPMNSDLIRISSPITGYSLLKDQSLLMESTRG
jgi:hypothetical protein